MVWPKRFLTIPPLLTVYPGYDGDGFILESGAAIREGANLIQSYWTPFTRRLSAVPSYQARCAANFIEASFEAAFGSTVGWLLFLWRHMPCGENGGCEGNRTPVLYALTVSFYKLIRLRIEMPVFDA